MSMRAARHWGEARDDRVRPELADDAHNIRQHLLPVPDSQRLAVILGITEIHRAAEKLPAAVEPAGGEQLLSAGHAQFIAELGAEHVLAAVAAREREIGRAVIPSARQIGDQQRVFVVGMRRDVEHTAHFLKAVKLLQNGGGRRRLVGFTCRCAGRQAGAGEGKAQEPAIVPVRSFK